MIENKVVTLILKHVNLLNYSNKSTKPCFKQLLETIYKFSQTIYKTRKLPLCNIEIRLLYVDFLK